MSDRTIKTCSIPDCQRRAEKRGWCNMHWKRWYRHGDPLFTTRIVGDDLARFWSKVNKAGENECWHWTGKRNKKGYGRIKISGRFVMVHRYSWELVHPAIPEGKEIDHRCHTPNCVNPKHLRVVTRKQNMENLSGPRSDNRSGYRGVTYDPRSKLYVARVNHHGEKHIAGWFRTAEDANTAVIELRNELFTHNEVDR